MRSAFLVTLSALILVGAFLIYGRFQTRPVTSKVAIDTVEPPVPPPPAASQPGLIQPGYHGWYEVYDDITGELKYRFRAEEYSPQNDGAVVVRSPVAEFYIGKPTNSSTIPEISRQRMVVTGTTGEVVLPSSSSGNSAGGAPRTGAPSRGLIHHCSIAFFNIFPDSRADVVDETIDVENVQFDNETMLITSEAYRDAGGAIVPADQVHVKMRGRKYDFDGRGMAMRWNEKDGRLELLEIQHGEQLVVRDPSGMSAMTGITGEKPVKSTAPAEPSARAPAPPLGAALASADAPPMPPATPIASPNAPGASASPTVVAPAVVAPSNAGAGHRPSAEPVHYVAQFFDAVRITQGTEVNVAADRMDVDFSTRSDTSPARPATAPGTARDAATLAAAGGASASAAPAAVGSASGSGHGGSTSAAPVASTGHGSSSSFGGDSAAGLASPSPAAQGLSASATPLPRSRSLSGAANSAPTTAPAAPAPLVVRWTGKMLMRPAKPDRPKIAPGDSVIELNGSPVVVRRTPAGQHDGDDVRAATIIYHTLDGGVRLYNSAAAPQVVVSKLLDGVIDPRTTITSDALDYGPDASGRKCAILTGAGHAAVPVETEGDKTRKNGKPSDRMMDARWRRGAKVYFTRGSGASMAVEQIDLAGDVDVRHPQLLMQSQAMSLFFEKTGKPAGQALADANRAGDMSDSPQASSIDASASADPQPQQQQQVELRRVTAHDSVHCELTGQNNRKQTIDCANLEMLTARSGDGKVFASQVNADGAVHAYDGDQDLRAGVVELTLKPAHAAGEDDPDADAVIAPATRPSSDESGTASAELDKLTARDHVQVMNKEGSSATGAELHITTEDGATHVRLSGDPLATVTDAKKNVVAGPLILVEPKTGVAHVMGAGNMHVLQEGAEPGKARPTDIAWTDEADLDGPHDRIDITGGVIVKTFDADGTRNTATGDCVHVDLMKKPTPTTQAATQPADVQAPPKSIGVRAAGKAAAAQGSKAASARASSKTPAAARAEAAPASLASDKVSPATAPANDSVAGSMKMDILKDKEVRTITILGHGKVQSNLQTPEGLVLRQFSLLAPKIIYQLVGPTGRTMLVPSAGQMLVRDHRPAPPATRPGGAKSGAGDASTSRGDTAFQWAKQLTYSETDKIAVMLGDVLIVHQPEGKESDQGPVRITGDVVKAWLEAKKPEEPATAPAESKTSTASAATTRPAIDIATGGQAGPATSPAAKAEPGAGMQIKRLLVDGHVVITRGEATLTADSVDYDPQSHWMAAHGSADRLAHYEDPDPHRCLDARDMDWNTQSWNVRMRNSRMASPK